MDTAIVVAIIGGAVTVIGIVASGVFGLVSSTTQRQDKVTEQRLAFKDEQIVDCERDLAEARLKFTAAEQRIAGLARELGEARLEAWEAKGRLHAAEVALLQIKTSQGQEYHIGQSQPLPPRPEDSV